MGEGSLCLWRGKWEIISLSCESIAPLWPGDIYVTSLVSNGGRKGKKKPLFRQENGRGNTCSPLPPPCTRPQLLG